MTASGRVRSFTLAILLATYVTLWAPFALLTLFAWELPHYWIGWAVILANPFFVITIAALVQRHRNKKASE